MSLIIWLVMIGVFLYSFGFAITLWKRKNKAGVFIMLILAFAVLILPFFSVFRDKW
ncbi:MULTISPECIES: hypothetical protein [unclassified Virgibacillus]|uniref:hypothetical protein n=1 Tax=unclassified Virgibacillus TaxID=2620237 RepID=UPI0024DED7B6|nr:hypothetical protein [Virgibacillus sp. LDC-1]